MTAPGTCRPAARKSPAPLPARDRRALLAQIHIARKDLALTEESYRDLVRRITTRESAGDCTQLQLEQLVGEFKRVGWKGGKKPLRPVSRNPQVRMIYGVWKDLKPFVADHGAGALRAFCKRQTGADAPEFLDATNANKVLEGLKAWLKRERDRAAEPKGDA